MTPSEIFNIYTFLSANITFPDKNFSTHDVCGAAEFISQ